MQEKLKRKWIPVSGPSITQSEIDLVTEAVSTAWYGNANYYNQKFEQEFATYNGSKHAISLPSCTSAIHLSLLALGIGPGDEVIVPDITWIASAAPIHYIGATPVFCDINPVTWCMDPDSLRDNISRKTRAIITVDLYGGMPDMNSICKIASDSNIPVIEDAAEAIGSRYQAKPAGSFGATGVFSFHGSKTMTTGEGGMLVTNNDDLYERIMVMRDHGRQPGDIHFFNTEVGYKYKMSSLQAALGLAQLRRINELVEKKREIFSWYQERLKNYSPVGLNNEPDEVVNSYWMVTAVIDNSFPGSKEDLMTRLAEHQIDSRPFFHPLSSLPAYRDLPQSGHARQKNKVAYTVSSRGINLPSGMNLDENDVDYICSTLLSILEHP